MKKKKGKRGGKSKLWSPIFVARAPLEGLISLGLGGRPTSLPSPSIVRQSNRSPNHPRSSLREPHGRPPSWVAAISPPLDPLTNAQGDRQRARAGCPQSRGPTLAGRRRLC